MSTDLDPIVGVTISADGTPLSREGFGTLAIVCAQGDSALSIDTYTNLQDVGTDYGTDSPRYRAARAAFSQEPKPKRVKFINGAAALAQQVKMTVLAASENLVTTVKIRNPDGTTTTVSYTADSDDTTTDIATALASALSSASTVFSATSALAVMTITNDTNGDLGFFELVANLGTFLEETVDPGYGTILDAALVEDPDFYGVVPDSVASACVTAVALWAQANRKIAIISNADAKELGSGGTLGAALVSASYTRTGGVWHSRPWEYIAAAWAAARLLDPEVQRKTWANAQLAGITVDSLTPTQRGYLVGDRWNFFVTIASRNVVHGDASSLPGGGYSFGGSWIDEVHGDDWLAARVQEDVAQTILDAGLLAYSQAGINALCSRVLARMRIAERVGILLPNTSLCEPPVLETDITSDDRQKRTLPSILPSAKRASAIHKVTDVNIALSY